MGFLRCTPELLSVLAAVSGTCASNRNPSSFARNSAPQKNNTVPGKSLNLNVLFFYFWEFKASRNLARILKNLHVVSDIPHLISISTSISKSFPLLKMELEMPTQTCHPKIVIFQHCVFCIFFPVFYPFILFLFYPCSF